MDDIQNELIRIEKLINESATDCRQWPQFLKESKEVFGAQAAVWAEYDLSEGSSCIRHAEGIEYEYIHSYDKFFARKNPWLATGSGLKLGEVSRGEDIVPPEDLLKTDFWKDWLEPQDLFHRLCVPVKCNGDRLLYLSMFRSRKTRAFDEDDVNLLQALAPQVQRAMCRNENFWRQAIILDVFDNLPIMVMVVSGNCRLLFSNHSAETLLSDHDGIHLENGKICVGDKGPKNQFSKLIAQVATGLSTPESSQQCTYDLGEALLVQRDNSRLPLRVVVSPPGRKLRKIIGQENEVALVYVIMPERMGNITEIILKSLFNLTPAEQQLAKLIIEGHRLDEAARKQCISLNTARTHMKHIYAKTDTGSQTDLVRLVLAGQFRYGFVA